MARIESEWIPIRKFLPRVHNKKIHNKKIFYGYYILWRKFRIRIHSEPIRTIFDFPQTFLKFFNKAYDYNELLFSKYLLSNLLKTVSMDKTRTIGQKCLANEPDFYFLKLKKCTKGQFNRSILSKVIVGKLIRLNQIRINSK